MGVALEAEPKPTELKPRRFVRVPADFLVHVGASAERLADWVKDLSEAGLGVETTEPLPPQTLVTVQLEFPHYATPLVTTGEVVWSTDRAMGIRFDNPDQVLCDAVLQLQRGLERI